MGVLRAGVVGAGAFHGRHSYATRSSRRSVTTRLSAAVVDGVDSAGFEKAMRAFEGALFEANMWQILTPDYMVLGERKGEEANLGRDRQRGGGVGEGGRDRGFMVSAVYWGHRWQYVAGRSFHRGLRHCSK